MNQPLAAAQPSNAHLARLQARFAIDKPEGSGPFPALILVPGSQGLDHKFCHGRYERATAELKRWASWSRGRTTWPPPRAPVVIW